MGTYIRLESMAQLATNHAKNPYKINAIIIKQVHG